MTVARTALSGIDSLAESCLADFMFGSKLETPQGAA